MALSFASIGGVVHDRGKGSVDAADKSGARKVELDVSLELGSETTLDQARSKSLALN